MTDRNTAAESDVSSRPTVLVVDDNRDLADLYADWLRTDYHVETAYSGKQALDKLENHPDVVLLDRRMPGITGDEVLANIRDRELDCRVVMVTAVAPDFDIFDMGFDEYITKPVDSGEIHTCVMKMLNRQKYEDSTNSLAQLLVSKSAIEEEKPIKDLQDDERYHQLIDRIRQLQDEIDELEASFESEDYEAAFRDL